MVQLGNRTDAEYISDYRNYYKKGNGLVSQFPSNGKGFLNF